MVRESFSLPGILTDIFGFSLLIPPFRKALCQKLTASFSKTVGKATRFAHSQAMLLLPQRR